MTFDPNAAPAPEPSEETPGELGAVPGIPQPGPGETAAGAEPANLSAEEIAQLQEQNRQLNERVGMLSQELRAQYEVPQAPPQGYAPQPSPQPGPPPGPPSITVEVPEEALATFDDYGIPREQMNSFAQGVGNAVFQQVVERVIPMVQETTVNLSYAADVTRRFFAENKDLEPFRQDMRAVADQFMANPGQVRGRSLEQCLPEIGNIVRLHRNLPGAVPPGGAPAAPKEAASVEGAQTAPGGSAGGAGGTRKPPAPKPPAKSPGQEYIDMRGNDHANRVLGGTRLGRAALAKDQGK